MRYAKASVYFMSVIVPLILTLALMSAILIKAFIYAARILNII